MSDLPTGTITFLFTDIEGSTRLLQRLGPDAGATWSAHRALLRAAFGAHGGVEVETQGDAFLVAFPSAAQAVAAAALGTRFLAEHPWPEGALVRVRMGLHTGTAQPVGDHYVGLDVHRAARIAAAGHGGQVLLSQNTRDHVVGALPEGCALRELGLYRLKDLQEPERLYQLVMPGLPADFPSLRTLDLRPHNLPVQPTPLLGRDAELAALAAQIRRDDIRLVTLTGPGGIGKTRLAVQLAAGLVEDFADGVWFVSLSQVTDPLLVAPAIAATLGLKEEGSRPIAEILRTHIAEKRLLLVLDNFEQIVEAAPEVAALLAASPALHILITSRIRLRLRGEQEYPLAPLSLPDPGRMPPPERLSEYAAVALLVERARAALPDFVLTAANAPDVAEICARLDGLPLAIELAAAQVKLLPPATLLQRLGRRLPLLVGGARDLEDRQRTMRQALGWSYDLLQPEEQVLFQRLAVFVGGCTLEAVEAICASPEGTESLGLDVLKGLSALIDHSLVQQRAEGGAPRFGMLQIIREYARERLEALEASAAGPLEGVGRPSEADALARAHAQYYSALAQRVEPTLTGPQADEWTSRLDRDDDNLRAALEWAHAHDELDLVAAEAHGLREYWHRRGRYREGVQYLAWGVAAAEAERFAHAAPKSGQQRADMNLTYGQLLIYSGQPEAGARAVERALTIFREERNPRGEGAALSALGEAGLWTGQFEAAAGYFEQALVIARTTSDRQAEGEALGLLGVVALRRGQHEVAADYLEQALALTRAIGDRQSEGQNLSRLGMVALRRGQHEVAADYFEQALVIARAIGDRQGEEVDLNQLGQIALMRGQHEVAAGYLEQALVIARAIGDRQGEGVTQGVLGQVALMRGQHEVAADYLEQALALTRAIGDRQGEGATLNRLGQMALMRGQHEVAAGYLEQSLAITREVGDRRWEARCLCVLGRVAEARNELARAATLYQGSLAIATERGLGQEMAAVQFALGCLLAEHLDRRGEGCPLLLEAAQRYSEMDMPEAAEAHAAVERLGCTVKSS